MGLGTILISFFAKEIPESKRLRASIVIALMDLYIEIILIG
jgi:hypothetical protein